MKVDFYVLETSSAMSAWLFTCQLIEQHYQNNLRVYVHTKSYDDASRIDHLLWIYKDISFIPHEIDQSPQSNQSSPIVIGFRTEAPASNYDLLINLSCEIPPFYAAFPQLIEIVFATQEVQQLARERFRYYREQGLTLNTIKQAQSA